MDSSRLQLLLTFLKKAPNDAFTLFSIAHEYMKKSQYSTAITYFEQLEQIDPSYVGAYYHFAKALIEINKPEDAIVVLEKGIKEAERQKDRHNLAELKSLLNELNEW